MDRLGQNVSTALRFLPPGGAVRAFEFHGNPGLVRLDPRWYQAALRFVESGFWHIIEGIDPQRPQGVGREMRAPVA